MERRPDLPQTPVAWLRGQPVAEPRRSSSALKALSIVALVPFAVYAFAAGVARMAEPSRHDSAAAASDAADPACSSPRASWRAACPKTESGPNTASLDDGPDTTGSVERKARRRTSTPRDDAPEPAAIAPASAEAAVHGQAEPIQADPSRPGEKHDSATPRGAAPDAKAASAADRQGPPDQAESAKSRTGAIASRIARAKPGRAIRPQPPSDAAEPTDDAAVEREDQRADPAGLAETPRRGRRQTMLAVREAPKPSGSARSSLGARELREARAAGGPERAGYDQDPATRRSRVVPGAGVSQDTPNLPPGVVVTSYRTYDFPNGRRVAVQTKPTPEAIRRVVAVHEAQTARLLALRESRSDDANGGSQN